MAPGSVGKVFAQVCEALRRTLLTIAVIAVGIAGIFAIRPHDPSWMKPVAAPDAPAVHQHGGSVRVVVSTPPEFADTSEGGNTLRSLVTPRLFDAQPDGTWRASLVQPGSDHTSRDGRTATFTLRDAKWSNGSPISVSDLQRTADKRFVQDVSATGDEVRVRFTQKLPGWRRLWSDDGIAAPSNDVSGGPFVVQSVVSGKETVLLRNDKWWGSRERPYVDEIRLQYVPDNVTARQLLQNSDVDVVVPAAVSVRTQKFTLDGVAIDRANAGGVWTAIQFNLANVPGSTRRPAAAAFPRTAFVKSLLAGEATVYEGSAWKNDPVDDIKLGGVGLTFNTPIESPLTTLVDSAYSQGLSDKSAKMTSRATDTATIAQLVKDKTYDVAFVTEHDGPVVCWQCRFGDVDSALAKQADSGDEHAIRKLEAKVRDQAAMLPLWREVPFVAYRPQAVTGVRANGFVSSVAWSAENWWTP